jgi:hypothetical protein
MHWRGIHCFIKRHAMIYWGSGGIAPRTLNLGSRWRWVASFTPQTPYHCNVGNITVKDGLGSGRSLFEDHFRYLGEECFGCLTSLFQLQRLSSDEWVGSSSLTIRGKETIVSYLKVLLSQFQVKVFWFVTPCSYVAGDHGHLKLWYPITSLHGVTTHKNSTWDMTDVKASKLA